MFSNQYFDDREDNIIIFGGKTVVFVKKKYAGTCSSV
jgi:hypothetical protein